MATNNSTIVFLINDDVRAVNVKYEKGDNAPEYTFKTMDPTIQVGDYVVIPTDSRHNMTVALVSEVDIELDFATDMHIRWIMARVDLTEHEAVLEKEKAAITAVQSAERRKKREELRAALLANSDEQIKSLELSSPDAKE